MDPPEHSFQKRDQSQRSVNQKYQIRTLRSKQRPIRTILEKKKKKQNTPSKEWTHQKIGGIYTSLTSLTRYTRLGCTAILRSITLLLHE